MKLFKKTKITLAALATGLALSSGAQAELKNITMCGFMLMGEGGPEQQLLEDFRTAALNWGAKITIKPYMNENIVVEEFKSGVCDIANMSSIKAATFNKFTGTIDAPGSLPTYDHMKTLLQTLAKPSAGKYMKAGEYEVIGIQTGGAIYLYTNDRKINGLADMAGKKMGILEGMPEVRQLVSDLGMTPVSSTVMNIFQKFNNGAVDAAAGPAIVYDMMELHKGMSPNGGILQAPLIQGNAQFLARSSALPEGFAQNSREYFAWNFDRSVEMIKDIEAKIPKKWWIPIPKEKEPELHAQTRKIRLAFRDKGVYDAKMLKLLRQIRCKKDPTLAECTSKNAE